MKILISGEQELGKEFVAKSILFEMADHENVSDELASAQITHTVLIHPRASITITHKGKTLVLKSLRTQIYRLLATSWPDEQFEKVP